MSRSKPELTSLVDTHCHLNFEPLRPEAEAVLERARKRGVARVVVPSYDHASWPTVRHLAQLPGVCPAFGLHPWTADETLDTGALAAELERGAVAIGEIGLDSKIESPSLERQLEVLEAQLEIAQRNRLPVILHCRGAFELLFRIMEQLRPSVRGVLHAFSRGPELARRAIDNGLLLGIGGAATRDRANRLHRTLREVGLEHLVLETDAPSIGLEGVAPEHTEPAHVARIAAAVAVHTRTTVAEVAQRTTANAEGLFRELREITAR